MSILKIKALLTLVVLAALLVPLAACGQQSVPSARPVAAWNFDEGMGTAAGDASDGNAGTLQGKAGWATGLVGAHALHLPGQAGSFVDVPKPVVDTTHSYTVAACVKLNRVSGYQTFVSIDGDRISGFFLQLRDDTGEFAFTVPSSDGTGGAVSLASSHVGPDAGIWYHLAGVYDSAAQTLTLYVNGTLQETVPFKTPWRAGGHTVIGRGKFGGNSVDFVDGTIDDVRVYAAALPAADVRAIAQADLPASALRLPSATPSAPATLQIDAARPGPRVSPMLYGLMTEEINYSYDGGLYAELIRNRIFRDDPNTPVHWSLVQDGGGAGSIALDSSQSLNADLTVSLKLVVTAAAGNQGVGIANDGYWGIPVRPNTRYQASFYAKASAGFQGPLTVTIESHDGATVYARAQVKGISTTWKQYTVALTTGKAAPSAKNRFVITTAGPGTLWFNLVSLFPPTYKNRPNGNRSDLMQKLAAMKPAFLRLPGGNYLEGDTIATRFDWKKTIGPLEQRPGHQGPWRYRSSDGLGLLEFLEWCEDLHMEPVLAVYAGYSLRQQHIDPGPPLQPFVQDALDEIEYVTGGTETKWGAERAKNGHPKPFGLHYVEIGNEDWFDRSGSYDGRFAQFYDAIKARYPRLQLIATTGVKMRTPDVIDEHYYKSARAFERDVHHYDGYDRKGPKIFVGEWASQEGRPTPDLNAALGDAAWMTGMERNSDIVILESYAPLLVNVNPGGSQWGTNLIGYDALSSYGSPSYYAQMIFATHHGDVVVPATLTGGMQLYESVTRDSKAGTLYLKIVNAAGTAQPVHVALTGVRSVAPAGKVVTLSGSGPTATNSPTDPVKIVPVTSKVDGLGRSFDYRFPPYSITILQLQTE